MGMSNMRIRTRRRPGLKANFEGECCEVGMYLAMARVAHREGYPEIGMYWEKAGLEEAEHAAKFAELLGEVVTDSTKKNLEMRVEAENGATAGKTELAKLAKKYNLDAIHDSYETQRHWTLDKWQSCFYETKDSTTATDTTDAGVYLRTNLDATLALFME